MTIWVMSHGGAHRPVSYPFAYDLGLLKSEIARDISAASSEDRYTYALPDLVVR